MQASQHAMGVQSSIPQVGASITQRGGGLVGNPRTAMMRSHTTAVLKPLENKLGLLFCLPLCDLRPVQLREHSARALCSMLSANQEARRKAFEDGFLDKLQVNQNGHHNNHGRGCYFWF